MGVTYGTADVPGRKDAMTTAVAIERLLNNEPILAPTHRWWESGVTFNAAALLLPPTEEHARARAAVLGDLADEHPGPVVAVHYRARPSTDAGFKWTRSFVGLAVFDTDFRLIRRFEDPVLAPDAGPESDDYLGSEDPRVTYLDGAYWMVYCGVRPVVDPNDPLREWVGSVCVAKSYDLVHWEKIGAVEGTTDAFEPAHLMGEPGGPERVSNKDGVLFPERWDGKVFLLHRPMRGKDRDFRTSLAVSDHPEGPFEDLGPLYRAKQDPSKYESSWNGAGIVPVDLGGGRYLHVGHTGNYLPDMRREYVLDAQLFDLNRFDPADPSAIVVARIDDLMRPETRLEIEGPYPDSVANVVFACGHFVHDGWLNLVYGGGDTFVLACRIRLDELVSELESRA